MDFNSKKSDILKLVKRIRKEEEEREIEKGLLFQIRKVLKKSVLLVYINEIRHYTDYNDLLEANLISLKNIVATFPNANISLIHLPGKEEVKKNRYNIDIKDRIEEIGIDYFPALELYDWSVNMFHENDGHPNHYGYLNISKFVAKQLDFQL